MCKKKKKKKRMGAQSRYEDLLFFQSILKGCDKTLLGIFDNEHDLKFGNKLQLKDQSLLSERKSDERY